LDPDAACAALDRVQGLVLTGGEDVEPSRYGAPPHPKLGETDAARDAVELALIAGAEGRRLPILAICRGIQILNVALGGTLYQDLASERGSGPIDHADTAARHALRVEPESLLHRTLGTVAAHVNSRHHQAIRALAPTLRATAWAADRGHGGGRDLARSRPRHVPRGEGRVTGRRGAGGVRDRRRLRAVEARHPQGAGSHRRDHAAQAQPQGLAADRGAVREIGRAARAGGDDAGDEISR